MKKLLLSLAALSLFPTGASAQVSVSGTFSPPINYPTLSAAFAAINAGAFTGVVTVNLTGNTTETTTAVLNTTNFTVLLLGPSGGATRTISGNVAGPLLDLSGTRNVIINGQNNGGNALIIENTSTSSTASTIRFRNDASNNFVSQCTIRGAGTSSTSGTILFAPGAGQGCRNNNISTTVIGPSGGNLPANAIYSQGLSATSFNSGTISDCTISDYFHATDATAGINLAAGNSGWTLQNNRLFQTATRTYTAAATHAGISLASGEGHTVSGNIIGFGSAAGTGLTGLVGNSVALSGFPASYIPSGTANATRYIGINAAFTAGGAVSQIQGNTIGGFALYTASADATANGMWCGIAVTSGNANIGTTTKNIIGAESGRGSVYARTTTSPGTVVGIYTISADTIEIRNNTLGAIDALGSGNTITGAFTGIDTAGTGVVTVSDNVIGNSSSDNIRIGYSTTTGTAGDPLSNTGQLVSTAPGTSGILRGVNNRASGAPINLNSNTLRNLVSSVGQSGTATALEAIYNGGSAAGVVNITGNQLGTAADRFVTFTTATAGNVTGILNDGGSAAGTLNVSGNAVQGIHGVTIGDVQAISNRGSMANVNLTNNQVGTVATGYLHLSGVQTANIRSILNSAGGAGLVTISGNDLRGISQAVPGTGSHTYITNQDYSGAISINDNTFTALTANMTGAGSLAFILNPVSRVGAAAATVNQNRVVSGFTKTGGSGLVFLYNAGGISSSPATEVNSGNDFSGLDLSGTTGEFRGWGSRDGNTPGSRKTVTNNTFSNISGGTGAMTVLQVARSDRDFSGNEVSGNIITNVNTLGSLRAIASDGQSQNFIGNTIRGLSGSGLVVGIDFSGGVTQNALRNRITDLQANGAGGVAVGISVNGVTTSTIANNLIGDLRAPAADGPDSVRGIFLTGTTAGTRANVYFNSIYLAAASTGSNFGSSGLSSVANASASAMALEMRNNLIVNHSTPSGAGRTVAFRRSGTGFANFLASSDTNGFHAGIPGPSRLIFFDGTNADETMAAYQARVVPADAHSFSESPTFLSTNSADASFLRLDPAVPTPCESGGAPVAGVTVDFDGEPRHAVTPDVGADEFAGVLLDQVAPIISYTPLGNFAFGVDRTLQATITDASGVPTSGAGLPRLYYSRNGGAYVPVAGSPLGGNLFGFTFGAATLPGEIVRYFLVAQDAAASPHVAAQPSPGAGGLTASPPAAATPPTTPSQFTTLPVIAGTQTVGVGGNYPTLTAAVAVLNTSQVTGPVVLLLTDASYPSETFPIVINPNPGASATNTITLKPASGVTPTITGSSTATCVVAINAADWVIIDGSNTVDGVTRDLTLVSARGGTSAVVCLRSAGSEGATHNVIQNLNLAGTGPNGTDYGIYSGGANVGTLGNGNHQNTYRNNSFSNVQRGLATSGASAAAKNTGTVIVGNLLNAVAPNNVGRMGIRAYFEDGITISQNVIENIVSTQLNDVLGIALGVDSFGGTPTSTSEVTNALVERNLIGSIQHTNTWSVGGIVVGAASSGTTRLINNSIYAMLGNGTQDDITACIYLGGGTGSTTQVYFNSLSATGTLTGGTTPIYNLAIGGSDPVVDVRNNFFRNFASSGNASVNVGLASATFTNLTLDYNCYNLSAPASFVCGRIGPLSGAGTTYEFLTQWQSATGMDAHSILSNPQVASDTNLTPGPASQLFGRGIPLAGILTDILDVVRSTTAPSLGAYETGDDRNAPIISYTALTSTLSTASRTFNFRVTDALTGVPTAGIGLPVVYFRKAGGTYVTKQSTSLGSGNYSAVLDYALLPGGTVSVGDFIEYFVVAQDNFGNAAVRPSAGAGGLTVNPPAAATPPASPSIYFIAPTITGGTLNVGTSATIKSLTNVGGLFDVLKPNTLTSNLTVQITSDLSGESGVFPLQQVAESGAGGYSVLIKPSGAARTVTSTTTAINFIRLFGADRVTIDGSLNGGTDRSLSFIHQGPSAAATVIWLGNFDATNAARNNTIKNLIVTGGAAATTFCGILQSGLSPGAQPVVANNDNTYQNNLVTRARLGIFLLGATSSPDTGNRVLGNLVGSSVAGSEISYVGINASNQTGVVISANTVSGVQSTANELLVGIRLDGNSNQGSITGNWISRIYNLRAGGYGAMGIHHEAASTSGQVIANNFISDVIGLGFGGTAEIDNGYGIFLAAGQGVLVAHNTIHLATNQEYDSGYPAALNIGSAMTSGAIDLRNNILAVPSTVGTRHAIVNASPAGASVFATINRNDYFAQNVGFHGSPGSGASFPTLTDWQSATGQDAASLAVDPLLVSATDPHLQSASPLANAGGPLAAVTTDFDGEPRSASRPEIGADELPRSAIAASLAIAPGALTPAFAPGTFSYTSVVDLQTTSFISVAATAADPNAVVQARVNGGGLVNVPAGLPVNFGPNTVEVLVTGEFGSPQQTYTITVNRTPVVLVAGNLNFDVEQGYPRAITQAEILAAATATAGSAPMLTAADSLSAGGGSVVLAFGASVTYQPAPTFTGADSFHYQLTNATGQSSVATINLNVVAPPFPPRAGTITRVGSNFAATFSRGVPGLTYRIEYSPDLLTAFSNLLDGGGLPVTATADASGNLSFSHATSAPPQGFYRAVYP